MKGGVIKMSVKNQNGYSLLVVVLVAVVVAIIVSVIVVNVTGNIIKVNPVSKDTEQVYTKAEIDKRLSYELQLYNLNTSSIWGVENGKLSLNTYGADIVLSPKYGNLYLVGTPKWLVNGTYTSSTIKGEGDLILTTVGNGALILNPTGRVVDVRGTLVTNAFSVTSLRGNGTAYACVDNTGKIVRSYTACNK